MRPSRIVALVILGAALAFLIARLTPFVTDAIWSRGSQSENLRLARQFIAAHDSEIHEDPRFHDVHLVDATIRGGCIGVIGSVASDTDNRDLRRILMAKRPPVELWYQIDVGAARP